MPKSNKSKKDQKGEGPKYQINIEGEKHPWNDDTITFEQIIELGGWDADKGVLKINLKTNEQETLEPGQEVDVKPGLGFSKIVKFKRGRQ